MSRKDKILAEIAVLNNELKAIDQTAREQVRAEANATLQSMIEVVEPQLQNLINFANDHKLSFELEGFDDASLYLHHDGNTDWDSSSAYC